MDLKQDEKIIVEALLEARKVQEYIWQELSLINYQFCPEKWRQVFQKRVDKISGINPDNPSMKAELRKRILQQAALSVLALRILDNQED